MDLQTLRFNLTKFRKIIVYVATAIVEIGAVWVGAPEWFHGLVLIAGGILVYLAKNTPMDTEIET